MVAPQPDNRRSRKNAAAALAKEIMAKGSPEKASSGDWMLWCLAGVMALAILLAAPKLGRNGTIAVAILMFAFLIHPLWQVNWVKNAKSEGQRRLHFGILLLVA